MNRFFFFVSSLSLLLSSCAVPEGYWTADSKQKSSAAKTRILTIVDEHVTHLSKDITLFTNLERLIVQNGDLEEVPEYIDALKKLKRLNVSHNELKSLPTSVQALKGLKRLNLSNNQLTKLPEVVAQLPNLEVLDIRSNELSELPEALSNLKKLNAIYIGGNNFTEEQRRMFRTWLPYTKIILRSASRNKG